jgi:hypothetical protein
MLLFSTSIKMNGDEMDNATLLAVTEFSHMRLLATLDTIEKNGSNVSQVLAWRPSLGRAHIAWQAMHCAATHDKYLNVTIRGAQPHDPAIVTAYGGGSTPSDHNIPTLATIRSTLSTTYDDFRQFVSTVSADELQRKAPNGRTVGESIVLLAWHEAHHQGQIHLTWNLYKHAHGMT